MSEMSAVNKTLYLPLYGKAMVSREKIILKDPMAEMIWEKEGFDLKGKTEFAVKASKVKNPIKAVGAEATTGIDYPEYIADQTGMEYVGAHNMTPQVLIGQLKESEQKVFKALCGGAVARRLYRMYEYKT